MELSQLVAHATRAFFGGFVLGAIGLYEDNANEIEFLQAVDQKELETRRENLEKAIERDKKGRKMYPFVLGVGTSALHGLMVDTDFNFLELSAVAVPSAYLGRVAGSALRYFSKRGYRKELEIARKISDDPENALSYIPRDRRESIVEGFGEIERKILADGNLDIRELEEKEGSLKKLKDTLIKDEKTYTLPLIRWAFKQIH